MTIAVNINFVALAELSELLSTTIANALLKAPTELFCTVRELFAY